mmetsp:Transcript_66192/g.162982  ORF Transcript_66192/g.162982 Transcript_66192/m.162982 type:complete len:280 (-) Transcript_66192:485-1324(-)
MRSEWRICKLSNGQRSVVPIACPSSCATQSSQPSGKCARRSGKHSHCPCSYEGGLSLPVLPAACCGPLSASASASCSSRIVIHAWPSLTHVNVSPRLRVCSERIPLRNTRTWTSVQKGGPRAPLRLAPLRGSSTNRSCRSLPWANRPPPSTPPAATPPRGSTLCSAPCHARASSLKTSKCPTKSVTSARSAAAHPGGASAHAACQRGLTTARYTELPGAGCSVSMCASARPRVNSCPQPIGQACLRAAHVVACRWASQARDAPRSSWPKRRARAPCSGS